MRISAFILAFSCLSIALLTSSCTQNPEKSASTSPVGKSPLDSLQHRIDSLTEILKADPDNVESFLQRAETFIQLGKYREAYNDGLDALVRDSTNDKTWLRFGNLAYVVGNYLRAENSFEKATRLNPKNADAFTRLAEFYLILRKYELAMKNANEALQINAQLAKPYFIKGWVYMENGDTGRASSSYQTAVELDPNYYDAYIQLGALSFKAKLPVALDYFNSALEIDPKSVEALYFKGSFLQERGRYDEALAVYKEINQVDSSYATAYYNQGYIKLTYQNQLDSAEYWFTRAIENNNKYHQAYYNRGYVKELQGKKSLASADYKLALGIQNDYQLAVEGLKRVGK